MTPHPDVACGRYQQAEFAADLWQVYLGEGTDEYRDPTEFFRRTFLTEGLKQTARERGAPAGGQGRRSGRRAADQLRRRQDALDAGAVSPVLGHRAQRAAGRGSGAAGGRRRTCADQQVQRAVLVGNKISPGQPAGKPDGTVVRTLWGELAWQLGGKEGYAMVRRRTTSAPPTRATRCASCSRVRAVPDPDRRVGGLRAAAPRRRATCPAGSFDTQFTFAQTLTEAAKAAQELPAGGQHAGLGHDRIAAHAGRRREVGGERGREALDRLRNVVGRVESSWRPASAEEGFEIVRRRLFEPMTDPAQFKARDAVARAFADLYRTQHQEFPPECREADYERRIKAAYPIHPEIFDRLYNDWSTLVKFQRTRGVLRLMAAVIHSLWDKEDRNPLIMPANIPIDDPRVQFELTRYLSDDWVPVIEKDVDGPNSLPLRMDRENPNLGQYSACRRVARTIYLGSAPTDAGCEPGLEDRQIKLGCVLPGESPAVFGDALRRLASAATYLYLDGTRYWYSTQPTVTKLAEDRAEQLKREPDKVVHELDRRLRKDLEKKGDFSRIHPMPATGQDVPDDMDARLVVLSVEPSLQQRGGEQGAGRSPDDPREPGQYPAALPQHARLPGGRQDAAAGPGRGGPALPRLGVDPGREGRAEPRPAAGEASGDPEGIGRQPR